MSSSPCESPTNPLNGLPIRTCWFDKTDFLIAFVLLSLEILGLILDYEETSELGAMCSFNLGIYFLFFLDIYFGDNLYEWSDDWWTLIWIGSFWWYEIEDDYYGGKSYGGIG